MPAPSRARKSSIARANCGCASQCADQRLAPAAGRAPSCARPARRLRSGGSRWRCTRRAAGSSRRRSAGRARARSRPSSGRTRPCAPGRSTISELAMRSPSRQAVKSSQLLRHRLRRAGEEVARQVGRRVVRAVGEACSSGRRSPSRRRRSAAPIAAREGDAGLGDAAPLLLDLLALLALQAGEEVGEVGIRRRRAVAASGTAPCCASTSRPRAPRAWSASSRKSRCADESLASRASCSMPRSSSSRVLVRRAPAGAGPGTGVNGIASSSFG